jgi:hypothetical protein
MIGLYLGFGDFIPTLRLLPVPNRNVVVWGLVNGTQQGTAILVKLKCHEFNIIGDLEFAYCFGKAEAAN